MIVSKQVSTHKQEAIPFEHDNIYISKEVFTKAGGDLLYARRCLHEQEASFFKQKGIFLSQTSQTEYLIYISHVTMKYIITFIFRKNRTN